MPSARLTLREEDVVRLALEFLHNRDLHITQLSLERETGVINGGYSDDVLFLRQLILDGQWDDVLEFIQPLEALNTFDMRKFTYTILRHKYIELLCIKSEANVQGGSVDNAVEEVVRVLNELEKYAPTKEDHSNMCLLLTLPRLTDHLNYKDWNPSNARVQCFREVYPLVSEFLPGDHRKTGGNSTMTSQTQGADTNANGCAKNDRLIQLIIKGILYESCVNYCQAKATGTKEAQTQEMNFARLLDGSVGFSDSDLSLLSWLQSIAPDTFSVPFEQRTLNVDVERLERPSLETSWTEHMLVTPIKPRTFPHSAMPFTRPRSAADVMSRSLMPALDGLAYGLASQGLGGVGSPGLGGVLGAGGVHGGSPGGLQNGARSGMMALSTGDIGAHHAAMSRSSFASFHLTGMKNSKLMNTSVDRLFENEGELLSNSYADFQLPAIQEQTTSTPKASSIQSSSLQSSVTNSSINPRARSKSPEGNQQSLMRTSGNNNTTAKPVNSSASSTPEHKPVIQNSALMNNPNINNPNINNPNINNPNINNPNINSPNINNPNINNSGVISNINNSVGGRESPIISANNTARSSRRDSLNDRVVLGNNSAVVQQSGVEGQASGGGGGGGTFLEQSFTGELLREFQKQKQKLQETLAIREKEREELMRQIHMSHVDDTNQSSKPLNGNIGSNRNTSPKPPVNGNGTVDSFRTPSRQGENDLKGLQEGLYDAVKPLPRATDLDQSDGSNGARPKFVAVTALEDVQAVRCAEFHPSGQLYAVGSNSKTLRICSYPKLSDIREDHQTYQPTVLFKRTKHHKGSIYCLAWSPAGDLMATGSNDKTVKLMRFNADTSNLEGEEVELSMHDGTIRDLCFLEDTTNKSSLLISGGAGDCKIYVTDCATGTPFQALSGHTGHMLALYTWGGAMFVSGSHDKTVRFWDLRTRGCVNMVTPVTVPGTRQGSPVASLCVDPSGRLLVSGHEDSSCVLYDIRGGRSIQCFKPHTSDVRSIRFSPSAYYLLTGGYDNKMVLTDLQGDLTLPLPSVVVAQHQDKVISGRWHPSEFSFLSTSADKTATLWALPPI